eukprot:1159464-Pelagomonas_calceolata.AAC.13
MEEERVQPEIMHFERAASARGSVSDVSSHTGAVIGLFMQFSLQPFQVPGQVGAEPPGELAGHPKLMLGEVWV